MYSQIAVVQFWKRIFFSFFQFNEFQIQVFLPNFSIVGKLSIPINELGPTKRIGDSQLEWTIRYTLHF